MLAQYLDKARIATYQINYNTSVSNVFILHSPSY
jgi:hypothetical protein